MTMFLRRVHHDPCLLLAQSFQSLPAVLLSPTSPIRQGRQSKQYGMHSCTTPPSLTRLLRNMYTSQFNAGFQQGSSSLKPQPLFHQGLQLLPPWMEILKEPRNAPTLKSLEFNGENYEETHGIGSMKLAFAKCIRPFLVSRCILLTRPLHDKWVQQLHAMNSKLIDGIPVYVTSLDLMRCIITLRSIYWTDLLNMLADDRVMVVEDWDNSITPIEHMVYDHGMQLTPQIGADDSTNFKAEYAALFHPKSGIATIASVIWKSKRIIDCQVTHGITCSTAGEAQGIALHNVLTRGRQLGITMIDVVTEVPLHDEVLKGTHDIDETPYPHICMAFIQAAKQYTICRSRLEPTELLGFVNGLAQSTNMDLFELEELLESKGRRLFWGAPVFRIAQKKSKILSKLDAKSSDQKVTFPTNCYLEVPEKSMKLDVLAGILSVLKANFVIVMTGSSESASEVQLLMEVSYSCSVISPTGHTDVDESTLKGLTDEKSAVIFIGQNDIPPIEAEKFLVVVFDGPRNLIHFTSNHNRSGALLVNIITPDEKASIPDSEEVNPLLYGFFRSCGGTVLHGEDHHS